MSTDRTLTVPDTATPEETAAIAAAIGAHLSANQSADKTPSEENRDAWQFTGRVAALNKQCSHDRGSAPADPWTAAHRLSRL